MTVTGPQVGYLTDAHATAFSPNNLELSTDSVLFVVLSVRRQVRIGCCAQTGDLAPSLGKGELARSRVMRVSACKLYFRTTGGGWAGWSFCPAAFQKVCPEIINGDDSVGGGAGVMARDKGGWGAWCAWAGGRSSTGETTARDEVKNCVIRTYYMYYTIPPPPPLSLRRTALHPSDPTGQSVASAGSWQRQTNLEATQGRIEAGVAHACPPKPGTVPNYSTNRLLSLLGNRDSSRRA